ncbi:MAG TPA: hypothetical protein VK843_18770 [Planctomycetota bacterium]|nr:hypothetical protein [Planctomycetota bacterium]
MHQLRPDTADSSRQGKMAEPGDILIVGDQAMVSCSSADTVLQLDLTTKAIYLYGRDTTPAYSQFVAKAPLFLSKDSSGNVYVSPLQSGNNTLVGDLHAGAYEVLQQTPGNGLPDVDLFIIDPVAKTLNEAAVGMGTVMFAHGINPATGEMWMLNTEAFNAKATGFNDEPSANGQFVSNRISVFTLTSGTPVLGITSPDTIEGLDPGAPTGSISGMTAPIGQPFSITFFDDATNTTNHGDAFLCGLLTDNVLVLDKNRALIQEISLPAGSIPRQVLLDPAQTKLLVYCWGTNLVRQYDLNFASPTTYLSLRLGHDPTPAELVAGRTEFFSAKHSRHGNLSCASCHIEGGSDRIAWNLSGQPIDDKGPMVTQTLVGIERMGPFHWRGERSLDAFHVAFKGLLGKSTAGGLPLDLAASSTEFQALKRYIFSLTNPANPNQNRRRVLDSSLPTPGVTATHDVKQGQDAFLNVATFNGPTHSCADCHTMPLGTGGDMMDEFHAISTPRRIHMKPTPFHELWRKEMSTGMFTFGATTHDAAFLGAGFDHVGGASNLFKFHAIALSSRESITAFVHQADEGLGQAAHYAYLLNYATSNPPTGVPIPNDELRVFLLNQAAGLVGAALPEKRNCDVVVFGKCTDASAVSSQRRWYWDRYLAKFICDDPNFTTTGQVNGRRGLLDFFAMAAASGSVENNVFLGLPVGMGERFGVDYDLDGTLNAVDSVSLDPAVPGPASVTATFVSAPSQPPIQVLWKNSRTARLRFDTNVPTRYKVWVWPDDPSVSQPSTPTSSSDIYSRNHSILLTDLHSSTPLTAPAVSPDPPAYTAQSVNYKVQIEAIPLAGTSATLATPLAFTAGDHKTVLAGNNEPRQNRMRLNHIVEGIQMTSITGSSPPLPARRVTMDVNYKQGGQFVLTNFVRPPALNRVVIARVFKQDTVTLAVTPLKAGEIQPTLAGSVFLVDEVVLNTTLTSPLLVGQEIQVGPLPIPDPRGVFLACETLSAPGVTMDFELTGVGNGTLSATEILVFSVEAVVEISSHHTWGGSLSEVFILGGGVRELRLITEIQNTNSTGWIVDPEAWAKWSFPDTTEAGATVTD